LSPFPLSFLCLSLVSPLCSLSILSILSLSCLTGLSNCLFGADSRKQITRILFVVVLQRLRRRSFNERRSFSQYVNTVLFCLILVLLFSFNDVDLCHILPLALHSDCICPLNPTYTPYPPYLHTIKHAYTSTKRKKRKKNPRYDIKPTTKSTQNEESLFKLTMRLTARHLAAAYGLLAAAHSVQAGPLNWANRV
jgi:hypothetical protein